MAKGIIIFGPSGAGKTTLGRLVAESLSLPYIDIDEYIWRQDTAVPFTAMYSKQKKIDRLMKAVLDAETFVMAGSMDSFHEHFDKFFILAVYLTADAQLRVDRVHNRELDLFDSRVCEGGDMYDDHCQYLVDVASYDLGGGSTSSDVHKQWAESLTCPVLYLDGGNDLKDNMQIISQAYAKVTDHII